MVNLNGGSTWSATYNAFGQRVERISSNGGRGEQLYDPAGQLLGHFNGANGVWWEQYVQFDGRLLWYYTQATNVSRYFHVNALGSLGLATDQTGAPVEEMLHYPFGGEWVNTAGFGWDEKFARFPQHDTDLALYETAFREYSPGLGRWMTPDKLAGDVTNPQSLNRYAYALNNPVSNIDPLGLSCIHTDDGTTVDNGDGKGCSEMNNNPQEVNVSGSGPGTADYYTGLMQLAAYASMYAMIGAVSGDGTGGGDGSATPHGFWARLNCASDYGDAHSIAAGIYAGKGNPDFVTNLFLGNAMSAFADLGLILAGERAPTASSFATHSLIGIGQGIPSESNVVKGPAGVIQDAAVGTAYSAARGLNEAPITGITGAAFQAGGETAATGAESFAAGVGIAKFVGVDLGTFLYGYFGACHP